MSAKPATTARQPDPSAHEALLDLGRALLAQIDDAAHADEAATFRTRPGIRLELAELISDANGEVVLLHDAAGGRVELHAERPIVAEGVATPHVTAAGEDVGGFRFVQFEGGPTLFFPQDIQLSVDAPAG